MLCDSRVRPMPRGKQSKHRTTPGHAPSGSHRNIVSRPTRIAPRTRPRTRTHTQPPPPLTKAQIDARAESKITNTHTHTCASAGQLSVCVVCIWSCFSGFGLQFGVFFSRGSMSPFCRPGVTVTSLFGFYRRFRSEISFCRPGVAQAYFL